ncbi:hypothetical protein HK102_009256 [Quaeritorhiza haematococci]|nr:hypothetical protein HK102_009256 [Quaeritorhiza haematococci]
MNADTNPFDSPELSFPLLGSTRTSQHEPLFQNRQDQQQQEPITGGKGRCWCCWEETETPTNPLIRACLGCKDPDLQYIHQDCIDQYVNSIPDDGPRDEDYQRRTAVATSYIHAQSRIAALAALFIGAAYLKRSYITSSRFQCSRCRHPYRVTETPVSPLIVLAKDPFLLHAIGVLVVADIVCLVCSTLLLVRHGSIPDLTTPANDMDFLDDGFLVYEGFLASGRFSISPSTFAIFILVCFVIINVYTWMAVMRLCTGETVKRVYPATDDDLFERSSTTATCTTSLGHHFIIDISF